MGSIAAFPSPPVRVSLLVRSTVEGQAPFIWATYGPLNGAVRLTPSTSRSGYRRCPEKRNALVLVVANWPSEGASIESNIA